MDVLKEVLSLDQDKFDQLKETSRDKTNETVILLKTI